jgi:hypothetical protein
MNAPTRRPARPALGSRRCRPPGHGLLHRRAGPGQYRPAGRLRHLWSPGRAHCARPSTRTHILATTQAIVDYRRDQGFDGPLFIGRDTHGLSEPAWASAIEVLVANDVTVLVDADDRYTPTPAVSHAILTANRGKITGVDGTCRPAWASRTASSSRPRTTRPSDGGFKYNPPHGGPADSDATKVDRGPRERLIRGGLAGVKRVPFRRPGCGRHLRLPGRLCRRPAQRHGHDAIREGRHPHRRRPARRRERSTTGVRSPSATGSTSPSSTRSSTRRGGS